MKTCFAVIASLLFACAIAQAQRPPAMPRAQANGEIRKIRPGPITFAWDASVPDAEHNAAKGYRFTYGANVETTQALTFTAAFTTPGLQTVRLVAFNDDGESPPAELTFEIASSPPGTPPNFRIVQPQLANLSTRGQVGAGDNVMIAGLIVDGPAGSAVRCAVRAIGPSMMALGVNGVLADPILELRNAQGTLVASNDNWRDDADRDELTAANLAPNDPRESALIGTFAPGAYTALVRGRTGPGIGLVEVYRLN